MDDNLAIIEKHLVLEQSGQTAIEFLSRHLPMKSKQKIKLAMKYGAVWMTSGKSHSGKLKAARIRRSKKILQQGDQLHVYYNEQILFTPIIPAKLVSDQGAYSVWNKPCGMFSQGGKWGDHTSICRWVELFGFEQAEIEARPVFLVHRLDRATNGIIIVAHTKKALSELGKMFEQRKVVKKYSAVVFGRFPEQAITSFSSDIDGKSAKTIIESCEFDSIQNQTILNMRIETGRKHQIRKHLSASGYPILQDRLYGDFLVKQCAEKSGFSDSKDDLKLRSCELQFLCPISNKLQHFVIDGYSKTAK